MKRAFLFISLCLLMAPLSLAGIRDFCPVRASYQCGQTRTAVKPNSKVKRVADPGCIIRASYHCSGGNN